MPKILYSIKKLLIPLTKVFKKLVCLISHPFKVSYYRVLFLKKPRKNELANFRVLLRTDANLNKVNPQEKCNFSLFREFMYM